MTTTRSVSLLKPDDEVRSVLERARAGDRSAVPEVRRILGDPAQVDWLGGDLARQATQSVVNAAAGEDLVFREALARKLELLRDELAGPEPTPIERLLVERVVACWLHVYDADAALRPGAGRADRDAARLLPAADGPGAPALPLRAENAGAGEEAGRSRPTVERRGSSSNEAASAPRRAPRQASTHRRDPLTPAAARRLLMNKNFAADA